MSEKPEERLTSAEIKKQIAEATKAQKAKTDLKESGLPLTGQVAAEINAAGPTPDEQPKAASKPEPVKAAEGASDNSGDLKEWAKKKGIDWTTEESVLAALRKSDQAFHAKRQAEKAKEAATPPYPPPPAQYPYPGYMQAPQYAPPPAPAYVPGVPNRTVLENIARQYNMTVEDAERLATFNRDFFEVAIRSEREQWQRKMAEIERENQKNSVFRELSADPVMRRPDVAVEFHNVLEQMQDNDPRSFEEDPSVYRRAFDRALVNIARRNLEGQPLSEGVPPQAKPVTPPTTPPRPLGRSSAGGVFENENEITPEVWARMSATEQRAWFEQRGLIQSR
jgi:hypothetical protein